MCVHTNPHICIYSFNFLKYLKSVLSIPLFLHQDSPLSIPTAPQRTSTPLRRIKCMKGHSDYPAAASSLRSSSLFQTAHCCHSICNVAWIKSKESSKDHLRCLPIMWLDILSWSPITFALFTEKCPHDTFSKLSKYKCGPNPPLLTTQLHSWIKLRI